MALGLQGIANVTGLVGAAGFNISLTPSFSASRLAFMLGYDAVFAVANLRYFNPVLICSSEPCRKVLYCMS